MQDDHDARVAAVADAVRRVASTGEAAHIAKGGVHHVVPLPSDARFRGARIDTSTLTRIIEVDPVERRAVAEPGVTFEQLVRATLPHGLVPTVVPELRGITVGGAVAGCSVESMSWRYGGFHDSCESYEVVTGHGEIRELSPTRDPELFHHLHGSYGTLGILTKATFRLVPALPYVEMTYRHLGTFEEFQSELTAACELTGADERHEFVDAIVHAPDHYVVCLGRFVETADRTPSRYDGTEIYYRSTASRARDVLRTEDYLFRYDTECHWLTRTVPPLEWRWVRRLVGPKVLGSTNLITWSNRLAPIIRRVKRRPDLVCDVFIPATRFEEFRDWYARVFEFWPLWVVPYRPERVYPWIGEQIAAGVGDGDLFIDCAVYGAPNSRRDRDLSLLLEDKVFELGGMKTLIGRNHYDRDRFWKAYDRERYVAARKQLDPDALFPDLYDKLGQVD